MSVVVRALPVNGRFQKHIEGLRTISMARVIADYAAEGQTEISFKQGSMVRVVHKFDSGWWLGECEGILGHFPGTFVAEIDDNPAPSPSASLIASPSLNESRDPKRRQKTIQELYDTERSYYDSLEVLFDMWLRPLQLKGMLKEDEFRAIFQGLDAIKDCSSRLINELKPQLDNSSSQLGDIFLALKDQIRIVIIPYVLQFDNAQTTINRLMKSNTKFASFVKETAKHERCAGRDLAAFLIMPIQRLPRYALLLGELMKCVPENSTEYASIASAHAAIKETTEQVNNTKGNSEKANEVKRVWDILEPQPPDLLEPHRRYRMEGELLFYDKKKLRPRYMFLFNDILLVAEKKDSGDKCALQIWVNLKSIVLDLKQNWPADEWPLTSDMQKRTPFKSLLFFAANQAVFENWKSGIQTALTELLEPEKDHLNRKLSPLNATS